MTEKKLDDRAPEIDAIGVVHTALQGLEKTAQMRVMRYVAEAFGLLEDFPAPIDNGRANVEIKNPAPPLISEEPESGGSDSEDELDGISSVAIKWMKRNRFIPKNLQSLFSLGVDDIDLIANKVPGSSKKKRMHEVFLLKAVASYLATGAARVTQEQFKEACIHYDAWDPTNAASYLKSFGTEYSGNKEAGYTLNGRGIQAATDLVKSILGDKS